MAETNSGAENNIGESSKIKFVRVVFSDKKVDIVKIQNVKQLLRSASALRVTDFNPKNNLDFVQLKYDYAVKISCNGVKFCRKETAHEHYRPVSILNLGGKFINFHAHVYF